MHIPIKSTKEFIKMKQFLTKLTHMKFSHCLGIAFGLLFCLRLTSVAVKAQQLPQSPDAPGVLTGVVTNGAGEPLTSIAVSLYRQDEWPLRTVTTDGNGVYRIGLLAAGIYQLAFRDPAEQYALQFYGGALVKATATDIVVAGQVVTLAPVSLAPGSQITGTITNRTGMPLGQIRIRAFAKVQHQGQDQWHPVVEKWLPEEAQSYSLGGLPAGVFYLCAGNYTVAECYPDIVADNNSIPEDIALAQKIILAVGQQHTNIDFFLGDSASRGEISGYVTNATGAPLATIRVSAYAVRADAPPTFALAKTAQTDGAGYYRLPYLLPSSYVIVFQDTEKHLYAEQFYPQADSLLTAQPITVTAGNQVGSPNVVMVTGGQMVGQVRVAGEVTNDVRLWFYRQSADGWLGQGFAWVDAGGVYTATGLATGLYRVQGEVRLNGGSYYRGYHGGLTPESATTVQVTAGATLTQDLDLVVASDLFAGVISGTVRSAGQPLAAIQVEVISANNRVVVYTTSDQQGRYQIGGLPDDRYYVHFADPTATYAFSWHGLPWSPTSEPPLHKEGATTVLIEGATIADNIDGALVRAGAIQGGVRWDNGAPALGITVQLFARDDQRNWEWLVCYALNHCPYTTLTDAQGRYHFQGLPPGRYRVGFFPASFYDPGQRYYPMSPSLQNAGDVMVAVGAVTTGIDGIVGPLPQIFLPFVAR